MHHLQDVRNLQRKVPYLTHTFFHHPVPSTGKELLVKEIDVATSCFQNVDHDCTMKPFSLSFQCAFINAQNEIRKRIHFDPNHLLAMANSCIGIRAGHAPWRWKCAATGSLSSQFVPINSVTAFRPTWPTSFYHAVACTSSARTTQTPACYHRGIQFSSVYATMKIVHQVF